MKSEKKKVEDELSSMQSKNSELEAEVSWLHDASTKHFVSPKGWVILSEH